MDYTMPTINEIARKVKSALLDHALSITYRPTEKTLVHMMLPHPEIRGKSSTGRTVIFRGSSKYYIQLTEEKNEADAKLVNNDSYTETNDAIDAFYKQIEFCVQMYGRVQPCLMKWC